MQRCYDLLQHYMSWHYEEIIKSFVA